MASQGRDNQPPAPSTDSVLRFLRTCPMLWGLGDESLTALAQALSLRRYDDGHRLFANEIPDRQHPLRIVVHGRANWSSNMSSEQKGAWVLSPGSVFGLGTVNDWAESLDLAGTWTRTDLPAIRCQAEGVLWVFELAPDRFPALFSALPGAAVCERLLAHYPTEVNAPDMVAAMRATPQFARVGVQSLYRLLEGAPMVRYWAGPAKVPDQQQQEREQPLKLQPPAMSQRPGSAQAMYFVISGQLQVAVDDETVDIGIGEFAGQDLFAATDKAQRMAWPHPVGNCCAITLTRAALERTIHASPGFARSLGPLTQAARVQP